MIQFYHVPKVAGSSFNNIIRGRTDVQYMGHIQVSSTVRLSFVRNPYERLVSAYFYLINGGGGTDLDLGFREILKKYADFKDFVLHIEQDDLFDKIIHIKPMYWFLCDENNKIVVDKVFKIEDIASIDEYLQSVGITEKLSGIKSNCSPHTDYKNYMDAEVTNEINRIYTLDFELFNYIKE